MENKNAARFVKGAAILAAAGVICKIIGAVYRIPLTNLIGTEAMGIYSKAYLLYSLLWVVSTSGLPSAISKKVAEYRSAGDPGGARRLFLLSQRLLLALGAVFTLLMILFSDVIARSLGISEGGIAVICIAPSLLLVAAASYMGYFQGMQQMLPTAVSQVIGSSGKLALGITLALLLRDKGPVYAASGALLGVTASELVSVIYIHAKYRRWDKKHPCPPPADCRRPAALLGELIRLALPITLCGAVIPLLNTLDAYLVTYCLASKGYAEAQINAMYGVLNGMVSCLVNVPGSIALSVSASLLPLVSGCKYKNDSRGIAFSSSLAVKLALILGLPCAIGLFVLAEPIIGFLYPVSAAVTAAQQQLAVTLLRCVCPAIIGLCLMHSLTGALQGAGKTGLPLISAAVAAVIKLVLGAVLMLFTPLDIIGAPVASSVCFLVAGLLNVIFAYRHCGLRLRLRELLPVAGAATVMASVCLAAQLLSRFALSTPAMLITVAVCACVYFGLLYAFKALSADELALLPFDFRRRRK